MSDALVMAYLDAHPRQAAMALSGLDEGALVEFVRDLPAELAGNILRYLAPSTAGRCLRGLAAETAAAILEHMPSALAAERMRLMTAEESRGIVARLPHTTALRLRFRLRYPEGTIGSLVDPDVFTLPSDIKVSEAIRLARDTADRLTRYLYVVDGRRRLIGMVDICRLLADKDRALLSRIVERVPVSLSARASIHSVEHHPAWASYDNLPVTDRDGVFQGVLSRQVVHEEDKNLVSRLAEQEDLAVTQQALTEVFWLAASALGTGKNWSENETND